MKTHVKLIILQAFALSILSLGIGLAANALSPHPIALRHPVYATAEMGACSVDPAGAEPIVRISFAEAEKLCGSCTAAFVDARSPSEFTVGHIANAVHLPPVNHPDEPAALALLRNYYLVVVYDGDSSCQQAERVARRLQKHGFSKVRVLSGAWPAWVAAGGPGQSGACTLCRHREESHQ